MPLKNELKLSPIVHGHMRLSEWGLSNQQLLKLIEEVVEIGITSFDHADIYGNYTCEALFGKALKLNKKLRQDIQIITKCGIKPVSEKFPNRQIGTYDYSYEHIVRSVNNSLKNLETDYIDLLLLHRPSPLLNPEEVAKAFDYLKKSGKVLHFGVSNFTPQQFLMLESWVNVPLETNQIEISPYHLEHFDNGNLEFLLQKNIKPMAWSPLSAGKLLNPSDQKSHRLYTCLHKIANELNVDDIEQIVYSWLLKHPAKIIPVIGTGKILRIKKAMESLHINMTDEQWFRIYIASTGEKLP
jgi:predicted oxidoreductase